MANLHKSNKPTETTEDREEAVTRTWLDENPGELPEECAAEAESLGMDTSDPASRAAIRDLLEMDSDLFGDWDRFA